MRGVSYSARPAEAPRESYSSSRRPTWGQRAEPFIPRSFGHWMQIALKGGETSLGELS